MADMIRPHDAQELTAGKLDRFRRDLHVSLALTRPDSPARVPILAHLSVIEAKLAGPGTDPAVRRLTS